MRNIIEVVKSGLCTGCGLCEGMNYHNEIKMREDSSGFPRPTNLSALSNEESTKIYSVCPGLNMMHIGKKHSDNEIKDRMWGVYNYVGSAYSTNEAIRFQGSSGGVLTGVADYLLSTGMVEAVLVTIPDPDDPLKCKSILASHTNQLLEAAGSKYIATSPLTKVNEILSFNGKVAFIGKPCDVAGLKLAAEISPELKSKVVYYLSFYCAGVPSEKGNETVLSKLGFERNNVAKFWHRGRGWPGNTTAINRQGVKSEMSYKEAWGGVLSKNLQFRCKICGDGIGEAADLVAGDAWECDANGYPLFTESEGRSLLISRTKGGLSLMQKMQSANVLVAEPIDIRSIDLMQPGQIKRRTELKARLWAIKACGGKVPHYPSAEITSFSVKLNLSDFLKTFAGTFKRYVRMRKAQKSSI